MEIRPEFNDALRETINIGVGKAAGMLNELLNHHILLDVPQVEVLRRDDFDHKLGAMRNASISAVCLNFRGEIAGASSLVFPPDSAAKLVDLLMGEETPSDDLDAVKIGTLSEVGNIILNAVMGSFGNILQTRLNYSIPAYLEGSMETIMRLDEARDIPLLSAKTRFTVESHRIEGEIILLFELGSLEVLQAAFDAAMA